MTKREKIILAITGVVALVGFGSLFLGDKPALAPLRTTTDSNEKAQIQTLVKTAGEAGLDARQTALLQALQAPWRLAALYEKPLEGKGQAAKAQAKHRYTGYVELGSGRLAVVDGYEYQVGDNLEGGGFKVVAISPDRVTLESLANGDREDVPYEGQEALAQ